MKRLFTFLMIGATGICQIVLAESFSSPTEFRADDFGISWNPDREAQRQMRLRQGIAPQVDIPVKLTLKPSVEIQGTSIDLDAVASCAGDLAICEEAYGIVLGPAPSPGKFLTVTRDQVTSIVRAEWPDSIIELYGASVVRVKAAFNDLDMEKVSQRLQDILRDCEQNHKNLKFVLDHVSVPKNEKFRPGQCRVEFPSLRDLDARSSDWILKNIVGPIRLEAVCIHEEDQTSSRPFIVTARISLENFLPVARINLSRGDLVRPEDFDMAWVPVGRDKRASVADIETVRGRRLLRAASVGYPLVWSQLELPVAIRRGQIVRMSFQRGSLGVNGPVKALTNGGYGQVIDAIYLPTRKKLRVLVKDADTVEYFVHY